MAVLKVNADGKAPSGAKVGDEIVTGGGTYRITGVNADGSYVSELSNKNQTTASYSGSYDQPGGSKSSGSKSSGSKSSGSSKSGSKSSGQIGGSSSVSVSNQPLNYDAGTDYMALIERAIAQGDYAAADRYEQQRNAKIAGEGLDAQPTYSNYAQYLQQPYREAVDYTKYEPGVYKDALDDARYALTSQVGTRVLSDRSAMEKALSGASGSRAAEAARQYLAASGNYSNYFGEHDAYTQEQATRERYDNLYQQLNAEGADYQDLLNRAAASGNLVDAAIYETLRNRKIAEQGLDYAPTYAYADYLSGWANGSRPQPADKSVITDAYGNAIGAADLKRARAVGGDYVAAPIAFSELYRNDRYNYDFAQLAAEAEAQGRPDVAADLRRLAELSAGNDALRTYLDDQFGSYYGYGNLDSLATTYNPVIEAQTVDPNQFYDNGMYQGMFNNFGTAAGGSPLGTVTEYLPLYFGDTSGADYSFRNSGAGGGAGSGTATGTGAIPATGEISAVEQAYLDLLNQLASQTYQPVDIDDYLSRVMSWEDALQMAEQQIGSQYDQAYAQTNTELAQRLEQAGLYDSLYGAALTQSGLNQVNQARQDAINALATEILNADRAQWMDAYNTAVNENQFGASFGQGSIDSALANYGVYMDYTLEKAAQAQDYELQQAALELDRQKLALEQAYTMAQISQMQFEQGLAQAEFEAAQLANVAEQTVSGGDDEAVPEWKKGGGGGGDGDGDDSLSSAARAVQNEISRMRVSGSSVTDDIISDNIFASGVNGRLSKEEALKLANLYGLELSGGSSR